jgi:hypothetical protein
MLFYPACREPSEKPVLAGPVNSVRWELLREGLEDREYFWLLEQRLRAAKAGSTAASAVAQAESALRSPHELARSLTDYEKDPAKLYAARAKLAEAIEALAPAR